MEREQQELLQKIAAAGTASGAEKLEHRTVRRIADGFLPEGFVYATSILWQKVPE